MRETFKSILIMLMFTVFIISGVMVLGEPEVKYVDRVVEVAPQKDLVQMISTLNPKVDKGVAREIANSVKKYCKPFPEELIISLIYRESSFKYLAESSVKCIGLMQINPKAHPKKVEPFERNQLFFIDNNINVGCQILREYYEQTSDIKKTLSKYLGKKNKTYINDVLAGFARLTVKQQDEPTSE